MEELFKKITGIRKLLTSGFYFSYDYDLTLRNQKVQSKEGTNKCFQWNLAVTEQIPKAWVVQIIQGFVDHFRVNIMEKPLDFYLISRRSFLRGGTRFIDRGIDDNGYVANYVETEQILIYQNHLTSFTQIRGSAPIFFKQRGMKQNLTVQRSVEMTS